MASVAHDGNGYRRLLFFSGGKRRVIHLGKMSAKGADTVLGHVEEIIEARTIGRSMDPETAKWLGGGMKDDKLHAKLVEKGLAPPRQKAGDNTLAAFIDGYIEKRSTGPRPEIKPRTKINLQQVRGNLVAYFKADKPLADVTEGDAEDWRTWLATDRNLGPNTIRRQCGRARQLFRAALKKRLIEVNPFGEMKNVSVMANKAREAFISREVAQKVIDACPDAQWKLLFALSRFGGLRCPSEHLGLRWADINWETERMTVRSPKTEHHEGKGSRVVPIFPELRPYLDAVFCEPGESEFVITRYRDFNGNLRTQLQRIIVKAGVQAWPKLFQNLRSTRQTELAEEFPSHVVCAWMGNSEAVAAKHYLQVTDEHFAKASGPTAQAAHRTAQSEANSTRQAATEEQAEDGKCYTVSLSRQLSEERIPPARLERATPCLEGRCSIHLSYGGEMWDTSNADIIVMDAVHAE
jgi:integrase